MSEYSSVFVNNTERLGNRPTVSGCGRVVVFLNDAYGAVCKHTGRG